MLFCESAELPISIRNNRGCESNISRWIYFFNKNLKVHARCQPELPAWRKSENQKLKLIKRRELKQVNKFHMIYGN